MRLRFLGCVIRNEKVQLGLHVIGCPDVIPMTLLTVLWLHIADLLTHVVDLLAAGLCLFGYRYC